MLGTPLNLKSQRIYDRFRASRASLLGRLALLISMSAMLPAASGQIAGGNGDQLPGALPGGLGGTSQVDCSDPLMANASQCMGLYQESTNPMGMPGGSAVLGGLQPAIAHNYSDVEELGQQPRAPARPGAPAPEPLTEFQKFIAASSGQVLPVYGADLFRRVPSTFAPLQMAPVPPDYVIGPGDELRIRIWGQVNTQANVRVDRTGDIYLPQVGPIHVAGLPYSALQAHLREAVSRVYKNFDLTADVGQIRSIQVYVTGEARRPGEYTVSALSTLVDAIFSSGGPSVEGSLRRIELRRNGTVMTTFDLYRLLIDGDKSKDVKLLDGDVIFIPPAGPQAAVTGSVRMPGIYELLKGEQLSDLLADAGGVTAIASGARISIERTDNDRSREAMEVANDPAGLASTLDDGDLVRVYSIVPAYQKTVTLRGNTANPGRFAWHPGMRISDLIPDKESLLTRNYWWRRAELGLPAPEFQPIPELAYLHQPSASYPATLPLASQSLQRPLALPEQREAEANSRMNPQQATAGTSTSTMPESLAQTESQPGQALPAEQRAGNASLAAEQSNVSSETRPPAQRVDVRLPAPEIDWSYAVIERIDRETLKTKLIPFDLGKLVLQHDASQDLELQPGDVVTIFSEADIRVPQAQQTKLVRLEGEFVHAGIYSVLPGETLRQLVERAGGFTRNAYLYGSEFTRESTRVFQQARIDEYVQSMNLSIQRGTLALVTEPAASPQDLASSAAAAGLERQLLATLKQIRATGRIVLQFKPGSQGVDSVPDIPMEDGDRFVVPPVPSTVNVVGAVYNQNAFLYEEGRRVEDYLHMAGGPNNDADRRHAFLIRADGEVVSYEMVRGPWGNEFEHLAMYPGDTLVVPDKTLKPSLMRGVLDWTQLIAQFSQVGLDAAVLAAVVP